MVQWALLVAAGLASACDDTTAGQPIDSTAPPRLVHLTVQDVRGLQGNASPAVGFVQRNSVIDLLDDAPAIACSDTNPCVGQFNIDYTVPDFGCSASGAGQSGTCNDPLKVPASGVPLSVPLGVNGDAGSGMQIRLVFDKLLDGKIVTVTVDPTKPPGKNFSYVLADGIVELDDATGAEVPSVKIYDNGGSSTFTSDLMLAPFGPAIVVKPKAPLAPATSYTIKLLDPSLLVDREGNAAVDANGNALPKPFVAKFTSEPLTANPAGSFPDFTMPVTLKPNQIVQLAFWEPVDEATAQLVVTGPGGAVAALAYSERGSDPTMCMASQNPWLLDVAHTVAGGLPADWPAGDYTLTLTIKDATGGSSAATGTLSFTVAGTSDPMDPEGYQQHVLPAQCSG
jgi:hypothetical protein